MRLTALVRELERILGREAVLLRPDDLMLYEYDGLSSLRPPDVVFFPRTTQHVVQIVKSAASQKLMVVPRGAGTGPLPTATFAAATTPSGFCGRQGRK
jgi:FAD/FMN-containing dehydrogenase